MAATLSACASLAATRWRRHALTYSIPGQLARFRRVCTFTCLCERMNCATDGAGARQVTVLELSNLKKIGKRSTLLLLDKNGGTSKAVARELARLGFRKAYVVSGGFSGAPAA